MFIAARLTVAKMWKQPMSITDEWIKMVCIYIEILLRHEKNERTPFVVTWINLEIIIVNEGSQTEKASII